MLIPFPRSGPALAFFLLLTPAAPILAQHSTAQPLATVDGVAISDESKASGLKTRSWIKISQIRTLSVERVGRRLGRASNEEIARVVDGLNEILG